VILEILPELQGKSGHAEQALHPLTTTGEQVPLATFATWTSVPVRPLSISHQGQFPAITITSTSPRAWHWARPPRRWQRAMVELGAPPTLSSSFQGTAQAFQQSLGTIPLLIMAALVVVYLILGILYESYIHPITILSTLPSAGVGAIATLMLFGFDFSLIALIGIILFDRHRQEERHHDGGLRDLRRTRRAPVAGGIDPQAGAAALRPIMMTTMAAMSAAVPLMLAPVPARKSASRSLCHGRRPSGQPGR